MAEMKTIKMNVGGGKGFRFLQWETKTFITIGRMESKIRIAMLLRF